MHSVWFVIAAFPWRKYLGKPHTKILSSRFFLPWETGILAWIVEHRIPERVLAAFWARLGKAGEVLERETNSGTIRNFS